MATFTGSAKVAAQLESIMAELSESMSDREVVDVVRCALKTRKAMNQLKSLGVTIANCARCQTIPLLNNDMGQRYRVHCLKCNVVGQAFNSPLHAVRVWNNDNSCVN